MRICADCGVEKPLSKFYKKGKSKRTQKIWYEKRCNECHNLKFRPATGRISSTRFKKGQLSWNKGTKGICKPNKTSFKPGHVNAKGAGFKAGFTPWNKNKNFNGSCRRCLNDKQWREYILERDLHKCKQCSSVYNLHVHHIKNWKFFPELRFDINNGITLCGSCHMKLHKNGHIVSPETKKKISESLKGKKLSEEHIEKLRGHVAWNKNTIGVMKSNSTSFKKGHIAWNKNLKLGVK